MNVPPFERVLKPYIPSGRTGERVQVKYQNTEVSARILGEARALSGKRGNAAIYLLAQIAEGKEREIVLKPNKVPPPRLRE